VGAVLEVGYLVFNEGYTATSGGDWMRPELCNEALRLNQQNRARWDHLLIRRGLAIVETLLQDKTLQRYHLLHAVHAELLQKLGRRDEARAALH
jgi:predicted RNA polymerase sigma factor